MCGKNADCKFMKNSREKSDLELFAFLSNYVAKGIEYVICTDVSKDGLLEGSALSLYQKHSRYYPTINQLVKHSCAKTITGQLESRNFTH